MRRLGLAEFVFLIWGFSFGFCESFPLNEVFALRAFKEAIFDDPYSVLSSWNILEADPCNWTGVYCSSPRDHVLTLNLSSCSLNGFLAPELGLLSSLQELVLHKNNLLGAIPTEIGTLKKLQLLDLGMNQLSGPIPSEIGNLTNIMKIHLQYNGLTGTLPPELENLQSLVELRLDRNKLQGTVPGNSSSGSMLTSPGETTGFCRLSKLKMADFSYNFLVGRIPHCLKNLPRSSFQGNCFLDKNTKQRSSQQCGSEHGESVSWHHQGRSKPAWLLALEIVTGTVAGFLLLFAILAASRKCKGESPVIIPWKKGASNGNDQMIIHIDSEMLQGVRCWSRQELELACEDFSNIIGSSSDSIVYKGTVKDGPEIAVISLCIKEENWTGYLELYFQREVADLARSNHENAGKLLGYCRETTSFSRMLVFEYASNGTLYEHLHFGEGCQLTWTRRMKIIIGIARGLKYLHTELEPPLTISELNSCAVYLTDDFSPKLVDFESWKTILARSGKSSGEGSVVSGFPSSLETRLLDVQGNIFSFGVLLLELLSGRLPYCKDRGCLVNWASQYLENPEVMSYLVDPELKHFRHDELKVICEVVKLCTQSDPTIRPSMQLLCPMLESKIDISINASLKKSPLAWAELAISS
ncbi:hypothetical protein GIB67_021634 [Kingdonia uniflora]|uniref:Protein kinase domain-containing protein n=1 Tax=Kingdonia uniflora TaxID=39325 RepID=A0A7J7KY83_9MAGN|nr:hypothetical protein GIB67_021634 [Kingdonia uniflora]